MRVVSLTILKILCIMTTVISCSPTQESKPEKVIRDFYSQYILENSKENVDWEKLEKIKSDYCTSTFLEKIKNAELEADPFVDAQDFDKNWINSLEVYPIENRNSFYKVCFLVAYDQSLHCINVSAVNEKGKWKINSVSGE